MHQILFRLPYFGTPVYGYGVMLVIGFFTALALAKYLARRSGLDPEIFVNAALIALVSGIVGARLSHVLENFHEFTRPDLSAWQNLKNIFNMRSGGLTYYGGFLLAFPLTVLYGIKKKVPLRLGMDIMAPCIVLGLGFGRIGCFLNGCCHGAECDLPWAVQFPYYSNAYQDQFADRERPLPVPRALIEEDAEGRPRLVEPDRLKAMGPQYVELASHERSRKVHPAQLYSTITAWLIAASLAAYFTLPHAPGRLFALMMMLEGGTRYLLEMLRTEPPVIGQHLSLSMIIGLGLVAGGAILWVAFGRYQGAGATTYGSALASTSAGGGGMPK